MAEKHGRRKSNPLLGLFRLMLSLIIFALMAGGVYSAYKHFTGMDPLSLNPEAVVINLLRSKTPQDVIQALASIKATEGIANQINQIVNNEQRGLIMADDLGQLQIGTKSADIAQTATSLRFLVVTDSHNDNTNLEKAIIQARSSYPDIGFVIGLGDYTEVGTQAELKSVKQVFDNAGLRYFLTAGDHDLWDARDKQKNAIFNFSNVFGPLYQSFSEGGYYFIIIYNSDNYLGVAKEQEDWLDKQLKRAEQLQSKGIIVFLHEPLYHPSSDRFMGKEEPSLKKQAKSLTYTLKGARVKAVLAGDTHYFSQYTEPETGLQMYTIGALTAERNLQTPRYAIVAVDANGVKVSDIEVK